MFIINRYDYLMGKQKKFRNAVQKTTTTANEKIDRLETIIASIKYKRDINNKALNNKLTDYVSLTKNEVNRIKADNSNKLKETKYILTKKENK